jgi:hypothetical protein
MKFGWCVMLGENEGGGRRLKWEIGLLEVMK